MDNATTARLIREQLPPNGMSLIDLTVSDDKGGGQVVSIRLSVPNTQVANATISDFMTNLPMLLGKMSRERGAKIVIVKVELTTDAGEELLKYVYDFQLEKESWWQAEGLTHDWFADPPPPSTP